MTASNSSTKLKRLKWTREDYNNVLRAFYIAQSRPNTNNTEQTYVEWINFVGHYVRQYLNLNIQGNVRRDIFKNKRLLNAEIDQIRLEVNVSTADEPEEKINEDSASRNNAASLAVY